ncbi:hypothetical protein [Desulfoluna spongiiphila]|uniref:Uncharacterized protein n=1 Tax=Desulfoluna spongiiphila TaxID=419481 RepID=A0A1G5BHS2_9BACT|nr:hypothetical protein [Desulfoluna spongiiphila]SCX89510.1 hypothetical protein SAMN05216233_10222 [Desulfoluna spongiiphila]
MKITQDDKTTLRVEEKNRTIVMVAGIIMAFALVRTAFLVHAFGLAYAYYLHWILVAAIAGLAGRRFTEEVTVVFHRQKKEIAWRRNKLFGATEEGRLTFDDVEDVRIGYRGTGKRTTYRIEFVVKGEPFPLSRVYSQGPRGREVCNGVAQRILETMGRV